MDKILTGNMEVKAIGEDEVVFEGYANVGIVDDAGDLMKFDKVDMRRYDKNPVLLYNHNRDLPIGRAIERRLEEKGLWIKGKISNSKDPFVSYIRDLVKEGILKTLSIGFRTKKEMMNKSGVNEIMEWILDEISVVTLPCNMEAEFALAAKSLADKNGVDYERFVAGELATVVKSQDENGDEPPKTGEEEGKGCDPKPEEEPKAAQAGESIQECISRKIPKLIEEGRDRDQAIAIALSMCSQEGKCSLESMTKEQVDSLFAHAKEVTAPIMQPVHDLSTEFSPTVDLLKSQLAMLGELVNAVRGISAQVAGLAKIEESSENGNEQQPQEPPSPPVEPQVPSEEMQKALELSKRVAEIAKRIDNL